MKKILINGFSAKAGGGKVIFDNFINSLPKMSDLEIHIVCPPDYILKRKDFIRVQVPDYLSKTSFTPCFYLFFIPNYYKKNKLESVLNFGDLILPRIKNQTYFFDWAYLVLSDDKVWSKMSFKAKLIRKFKFFLIQKFKGNNRNIIVQSQAMKIAYADKLTFNGPISVIPTPVANFLGSGGYEGVKRSDLIYISNYAPHKNFEIIPEVVSKLDKLGLDFRILVTLDNNSREWKELESKLDDLNVRCRVKNLGYLSQENIFKVLKSVKGLFFPSLLESYGIPLIEAMYCGCPIITSDIPFIKSVCKEGAIYFDPYDSEDICNKIKFCLENTEYITNQEVQIKSILKKIPDWNVYSKTLLDLSC